MSTLLNSGGQQCLGDSGSINRILLADFDKSNSFEALYPFSLFKIRSGVVFDENSWQQKFWKFEILVSELASGLDRNCRRYLQRIT
ncbi:hypothetical protein CDAR_299851 [Caerostris darwini]|uniref:LAGLIDADG homing endonuclease n=1 Tax=Caerostris darwini TaxID=1538125 RepID=A0AAV4W4H1_9ARAC|nr:hypothetical protein CDAR_299851 [Caerostris darwini]